MIYTTSPFWAWNGELEDEEMIRQIETFQEMRFGGFIMHTRTGLTTEYLSGEFMRKIRLCAETAERLGMKARLYDEDRWPSGSCGGKLTRGENMKRNGMKYLLFTPFPYAEKNEAPLPPAPGQGQMQMRRENGRLAARYDVVLDKTTGELVEGNVLSDNDDCEHPKGTIWYAYLEHAEADPWFNLGSYIDTLSRETVGEFITSTHEKYKLAVGDMFGKTVPSIFTDEPQFMTKSTLTEPHQQKDVFLPWTDGLEEKYEEKFGENLLEHLPEMVWEMQGGRLSSTRWQFQKLVCDIFAENYCGQIGDWCRKNGVQFMGHVMNEPTLESQTGSVGDAMHCYNAFDIPGIDMLCDYHEYTTAKQAASIVHQDGKSGMMSEMYGVTGWDADFRTYKLQGDWQAALGVTLRVPHLAWYTMKGEAKRDYPASISFQSHWCHDFRLLEDHFARVNDAMSRGEPAISVAVVHPIESFWMHFGNDRDTGAIRSEMEQQFSKLCETLIFGKIDFDYICEAELPRQCKNAGNPLNVGKMHYTTVIVPPVTTLRSSTVAGLTAFARSGGNLIFLGSCPEYVDGKQSSLAESLYNLAKKITFSPGKILRALENERRIHITDEEGNQDSRIITQLRHDGSTMWLFAANGKNPDSPDVDTCTPRRFALKGNWSVTLVDTISGELSTACAQPVDNWTVFTVPWHMHTSLLARLDSVEIPE